jgi:putative transposase
VARLPRLVIPGLPHLIIHRGHGGQSVFLDDEDYALYLRSLTSAAREAGVAMHGYGLLPSEARLLATPSSVEGLAEMMQAVGRRFVPVFNRKHGRGSSPFEGRFRSTVVDPDSHFIVALQVVETLALASGTALAAAAEPPAWSSLAHHLGIRSDPRLTEHAAFWKLGNTPFEREAGYRQLVEKGVSRSQAESVLHAAATGWALGSEEFAARIGAETGRRSLPLPRGRPRRQPAGPPAR